MTEVEGKTRISSYDEAVAYARRMRGRTICVEVVVPAAEGDEVDVLCNDSNEFKIWADGFFADCEDEGKQGAFLAWPQVCK